MDAPLYQSSSEEFFDFFQVSSALGLSFPALQKGLGYELSTLAEYEDTPHIVGIYSTRNAAKLALRNSIVEKLLEGSCFWIEDFENEEKLKQYIQASCDDTIISDYYENWDQDNYSIEKITIEDESRVEFLDYDFVDSGCIEKFFKNSYEIYTPEIFKKYQNLSSSGYIFNLIPGSRIYSTTIILDHKFQSLLGYSAFQESGYRLLRNWVIREWRNMGKDLNEEGSLDYMEENSICSEYGDAGIVDYYFNQNSEDSFAIDEFEVKGTPERIIV